MDYLQQSNSLYSPLLPGEFRLINLLPTSHYEAPIECVLLTSQIKDAPSYEAISYVWGRPTSSSAIWVNGSTFSIWPNLHAALRRLRHFERPRLLWADAICINMYDQVEKNHQVAEMGEIYRSARNVCIWLGEENESSDSAIRLLREVSYMTDVDDAVRGLRYEQKWNALTDLLSRPWFERLWIVQEVALAQRSTIHCGSFSASWGELETGVSLLERRSNIYPETSQLPKLSTRRLVFNVKKAFQRNDLGEHQRPLLSLETLVTQLSSLACTDPRDKIYGLLSLAKDAEQWLPPDYSKPPGKLYEDFVKFAIAASESLDIIVRRWAPSDAASSTPSWVCTVDEHSYDMPLQFVNSDAYFISNESMRNRRYNASGNWKPPKWWEIQNETKRLDVKGFCVDVIESVTSTALNEGLPEDWLKLGLESPYFTPDAFWRTLLADRDPMGTASSLDNYKELLEPIFSRPELLTSRTQEDGTRVFVVRDSSSTPRILFQHMQAVIWNRALAKTRSRHLLALIPGQARPGDIIYILYGCSVPVILREVNKGCFQLVGECYVHGIMDGEFLKENARDDAHENAQQITIEPTRVENVADDVATLRHFQKLRGSLELVGEDTIFTEADIDKAPTGSPNVDSLHTDGVWRQFHVHWTNSEGYQGSDLLTELLPGSVKRYAEALRKEDVSVRIEEIGIADPIVENIKTLVSFSRRSLNNILITFKDAIPHFRRPSAPGPIPQSTTHLQSINQPDPRVAMEVEREPTRNDFLLLCINDSDYLTTRNDVNVALVLSDQHLFSTIQQHYFSRRTRVARLISLKSVQRITFVKFALRENNEVDCLQPDNIPPVTETHYELDPWPPGHIPPIGNSYLMRRFNSPGTCRDSSFCLKQFPKRILRRPQRGVPPDFDTGWGLHFQEGYDPEKIAALVLIGVLFSLVIGIVWSAFHSIAAGLQIAGYIIATWTLGFATLQFAIKTP